MALYRYKSYPVVVFLRRENKNVQTTKVLRVCNMKIICCFTNFYEDNLNYDKRTVYATACSECAALTKFHKKPNHTPV